MSRTKSVRRKKIKIRVNDGGARKRSGNVRIFKVVDPILQAVLIVSFICCDVDGTFYGFSYLSIVYALAGLQFISSIANLFFKKEEYGILTISHIIYAIVIVPFMYFYHSKDFTDNAAIPFGFGYIPWIYTTLNVCVVVLAFWYNIVCLREVKTMFKSYNEE
jgi:hypothetical protein